MENQVPQGPVPEAPMESFLVQVATIPETEMPLFLDTAPKMRKVLSNHGETVPMIAWEQ